MNKIGWIVSLIIFVFITVFVLSLDTTTQKGRVKISNRNVEIGHENTEVTNDKVNLTNSSSKFINKDIQTSNSGIDINSNGEISNKDVNINDLETNYENQDSRISNNGKLEYKNLDDSEIEKTLNSARNSRPRQVEPKPVNRYLYKNIDWSTWKSNFVNKILDDSLSIRELDEYSEGAWFHYSFDVNDEGKISNIKITSMFLSKEDKAKVSALIKSYEGQEITVFPANSKRKYAKVSAVMVLSNHTEKSRPSDFADKERIKIKLN